MSRAYKGYTIASHRCAPHSLSHYAGGDDIVREDLSSGRRLLWTALRPDGTAVHDAGRAYASERDAERAVDRDIVAAERDTWQPDDPRWDKVSP